VKAWYLGLRVLVLVVSFGCLCCCCCWYKLLVAVRVEEANEGEEWARVMGEGLLTVVVRGVRECGEMLWT